MIDAASKTNAPPPKILIAEDDPISRSLLELHLEMGGYSYLSAKNGREALELFQREQFSIVITDWLMPEMDGTALCRAIRSQPADSYTFIIILTSQSSQEALVEGLEAGADDYIIKPINPAELRVRLSGARRILDLESALKRSLAETHELLIHDPLTGAFNRGYMDQQLKHEVQRAYRYRHPLSIMICDLDHFKRVNDTYGHQTGDKTLQRCVINLNKGIRNNIDWVARYGGEEFVIVLPETDAAGCSIVAERIRERVAADPDAGDRDAIKVTASFGTVTLLPDSGHECTTPSDLLQCADVCLYLAKKSGRNRVVAHTTTTMEAN